jgi:hypothetical protein
VFYASSSNLVTPYTRSNVEDRTSSHQRSAVPPPLLSRAFHTLSVHVSHLLPPPRHSTSQPSPRFYTPSRPTDCHRTTARGAWYPSPTPITAHAPCSLAVIFHSPCKLPFPLLLMLSLLSPPLTLFVLCYRPRPIACLLAGWSVGWLVCWLESCRVVSHVYICTALWCSSTPFPSPLLSLMSLLLVVLLLVDSMINRCHPNYTLSARATKETAERSSSSR